MTLRFCLFLLVAIATTGIQAKTLTPGHKDFRYGGRIDDRNSNAPVLVWQASTVETQFSGSALEIGFSRVSGQAFFDLTVDGQTVQLEAVNGWLKPELNLEKGWHSFKLFKRSEASAGFATFTGVKIDGELREPTVHNYQHRFVFYGDSITVGACNEDGNEDQWDDRSTHNSAKSYTTLVASHFNADFRNLAISGVGISAGYQPYTIPGVWDHQYPDPESATVKVGDFKPDIVFTNFGENDDSYTRNQQSEFPANYADNYIRMVKEMRKQYPDSRIVILRGGMFGGAQSERLLAPWKEVVNTLEKDDPNITHFVFKTWYHLHPRVEHHRKMADELIEWLAWQAWF